MKSRIAILADALLACHGKVRLRDAPQERLRAILYPESSGFLVSGWTPWPGEALENSKKTIFLIGCPVTACIVLPQKSCGTAVSPGDHPLTKKPEDCGYEIGLRVEATSNTNGPRAYILGSGAGGYIGGI